MKDHARPLKLKFYSREGCHLCDEARSVIESLDVAVAIELEEIDIESSDELMLSYLERIPVVEWGGEVWFEFTVERARLSELVAAAASIDASEHDD
ncbi:MAG: glutaredoxin family protein [Actinomycetes bacterium]